MAKIHNITMPDGSTIPVPAWATEDTMSRVAGFMAASLQQVIQCFSDFGYFVIA